GELILKVVAPDVAARGLDVPRITHVFNVTCLTIQSPTFTVSAV
ncbi:hypothetical protein PSYMO_36573, partial [Pseudomonas amygdali pv. mori str. 301020]